MLSHHQAQASGFAFNFEQIAWRGDVPGGSQRLASNNRITAVTNAGTQRVARRVTHVSTRNLISLSSHQSKVLISASIGMVYFGASMQRET